MQSHARIGEVPTATILIFNMAVTGLQLISQAWNMCRR